MPEIRPLRAWRYHPDLIDQIGDLTSPLFDVITDKQRQALYKNPINSIHLSVPVNLEDAISKLEKWKKEKVIVQDCLPGIYVYYQYFNLPGVSEQLIRKGIIVNVKLHTWSEKRILHHEDTMPHSVSDRLEVLEKLQMMASPTHGLYSDDTFMIEKYTDEAIRSPLYETEDYQGVRDVLSVIHDRRVIKEITDLLKDQQVILADGHHRYEGSLMYMLKRKQANPHHIGNESYNYHMMYLTNTKAKDLRILPTHRLIKSLEGITEDAFIASLSAYFHVRPIDYPEDLPDIMAGKKWTFGLIFKDNAYKIRLKEEIFHLLHWDLPDVVKQLDLTVLHYFIFEKILGWSRAYQRQNKLISFERNFAECERKVNSGEVALAIITHEITIDEVVDVCQSGHTLPQKSTYFYPKVISGFVFSSIEPNEFHTPFVAGI